MPKRMVSYIRSNIISNEASNNGMMVNSIANMNQPRVLAKKTLSVNYQQEQQALPQLVSRLNHQQANINQEKGSMILTSSDTPSTTERKFDTPLLSDSNDDHEMTTSVVSVSDDDSSSMHSEEEERPSRDQGSTKHLNPAEAVAIQSLLNFKVTMPQQQQSTSSYRDFSEADISEIPAILGGNRQLKSSFPIKLYSLLERSEADGYSSIVSWVQHGRSFKIYNQNLFVKKIMPIYFYQTKMSSFVRQLSTYGFHKIVDELNADRDTYYHELFLRGREDLCPWIVRQKKRSLIIDPKEEPDLSLFKAMPRISKPTTPSMHPFAKRVQYQELPPNLQQQQIQHQINQINRNDAKLMQLKQAQPMQQQFTQQNLHQYHQSSYLYPRKSLLASIVRKRN